MEALLYSFPEVVDKAFSSFVIIFGCLLKRKSFMLVNEFAFRIVRLGVTLRHYRELFRVGLLPIRQVIFFFSEIA